MTVEEHVVLAPHTTLNVGGEARYFARARSLEEVWEALRFAHERSLRVFVLGGGSNIVIADSGLDGLVLALEIPGISTREENQTLVTVGSGVVWDEFVQWSIKEKFAGLECLSGVPGTVGGAVVANLGAYGAQCSDTFVHAEVIDTQNDKEELVIIEKRDCNFSYHDSMFGHVDGRYIIIRATFALSKDPAVMPSYRDNRFDMTGLAAKLGHTPSQEEVREAVLSIREQKGSLHMPGRLSYQCAGSFFHMPFVSAEQYKAVEARARELDSEKEERLRPWAWKQPDGMYKLAPGFLLEYTQFQKGYTQGPVGISPRHTLTVINVGGARAEDIVEFAKEMQSAVEKTFNISLEREVEYIGFTQ
jgi:UDP-N-acetylmuramate dehydrogenase